MRLRAFATAAALLCFASPALTVAPELAATLEKTVARYGGLTSFHARGLSRIRLGGEGGQVIEVPTVVAGAPGGRLHVDLRNPMMATRIVMDGADTWVFAPQANQYVKQPSENTGDDAAALKARLESTPFGRYFQLADPERQARLLGEVTLPALGRERKAWVVAAEFPKPDAFGGEMLPFVFWIDRETHWVLRDSLTMKVPNPNGGPLVELVQVTDWSSLETDTAPPDSLFAFTPPEGARLMASPNAPPPSPLVDQPASEFALADLAGKSRALSSYRGKVVVLDFWATWCGPCRRSMPDLQKLQTELGPKGLQVLSVNVREEAKTISPYLKKQKLTLKVLLDRKGEIAARYGATGIPTLVVIDRKGVVRAWYQGVQPEQTLRDAIAKAGL